MARKILSLVVIFVALTVVVGSAEIAIRVVAPWYDPAKQVYYVPGPGRFPSLGPRNKTVYVASTNSGEYVAVHFDRLGLRQAGDVVRTGPESIFVVGNRFAFGWGVTEYDRFSDLLAAKLGVPVHNIAILGNLPQGHLKLVHYVESIGAPVHRLLITVPMDYAIQRYPISPEMSLPESAGDTPSLARLDAAGISLDAYKKISATWRVPYNSVSNESSAASPKLLKEWLIENSAVYRFVLTFLHSNLILNDVAVRLGLFAQKPPVNLHVYDPVAIEATANLLADISGHYDAVMILVPSPAVWLGEASAKERERHAAFAVALTAKNISFVDLLPFFDRAGGAAKLLRPRELDWNSYAHIVTADALAPVLQKKWKLSRP